jgi:hypothetical protein
MQEKKEDGRGRPRIHDRDQIASDLIEWAKLADSINLNGFCCTRDPPIQPSKLTQWRDEDEYFRKAYEIAKSFIASRREILLNGGKLHVKAYDLNATTYDHFLKEDRRETARFEAALSKEVQSCATEHQTEALNAMIGFCDRLQDSALNIDKSNSKAEP